ncbi:MAG: hypothetical protein JW699_06095 [Chitinispirillaceae bacterium]|nr:hypothetical protein [Chitinispirillaceae bacterium]
MVIPACAALLCLAVPAGAFELRFVKETIAVSLQSPDTVEVRGEYYFTAAEAAVTDMGLFFPFPVDSFGEYPCFIEVRNARSGKAIEFGRQEEGIMFPVSVRAGDTTAIGVVYKQRVKNRTGRYILTTTDIWGRPLVDSRYSVSVPDSLVLTYVSYECDSVVSAGGSVVYQFYKKRFMPDRDLTFSWSSPPAAKRGTAPRRGRPR